MYQLLIVDDEPSVVDSLSLTIPWEEYGIETVYRAYSAEEALLIATKHAVDIMITDIRMPEMDGLELIDRVRHFSRKIRCIILSGHDEFEYAQKAIQYQALSYLLKPVNITALIQSVKEAIEHIEQEWSDVSSYQRIKQTLHTNKPLLKNQLLNELLKNKSIETHQLEERLAMMDVSFRAADPFIMMVVRLEEDFAGYDLHSLSLLEYAVCNIAEEVFLELFELWHCITDQGYLVFLIKSSNENKLDLVDSYAVKLQNHTQKYLKGSLSICLSQIGTFPLDLNELFHASISAIHRNIGKHKSYFITTKDVSTPIQYKNVIDLLQPPTIQSLIEIGNWEEAIDRINRVLSMNDPNNEPTYDQLFTILLQLSATFSLIFITEGTTIEERLGEEFDLLLYRKSQLSRQRLFDWAEKMIYTMRDRAAHHMEDSHQRIASKVRSYIQEHLADGISLQTVAEHVGLHPVYLSKVYKNVTDETVGEYLYRIRMERAAHLLRSTDLKVSEVSIRLGFYSAPHFIKIFRKHYQCTPQEYRGR